MNIYLFIEKELKTKYFTAKCIRTVYIEDTR